MSSIPQEWIEAGADAVYRHAARLGVPAHTITAGQLVTAALTAVLPLIREALAQEVLAGCVHMLSVGAADESGEVCYRCEAAAKMVRGGAQ